jgi:PAS domain S-box-containing protein
MTPAALPPDEALRLAALRRYAVMDTEPDAALDELTHLAAQVCGTPMALISLVDETRQWFKSRVGLDAPQTPREQAFCAHALLGSGLFTVADAQADPRFADNPLVTADPNIRFYAGAPLVTPGGQGLGTLCVLDHVPRALSAEQEEALRILSRQVMAQLERRRLAIERGQQPASDGEPPALAPANDPATRRATIRVGLGFSVALLLLLGIGIVCADSIRDFRELTAELALRNTGNDAIENHLQAVALKSRVALGWLVAGGALSALLLGAAFYGLRREVARRQRAVQALRQAHDSVERQVRERSAELMQANVALRESFAALNRIGDNLPNGYLFQATRGADGQRRISYVSAGVQRVVGVTPQAVMNDPVAAYGRILDEDRPAWMAAEEASTRSLSVFSAELRLRRPDGEIVWLHLTSAPVRLPDGSIGWDGIGLDITQRKRAEAEREALLTSERAARIEADAARLQVAQILARVSDAFMSFDPQWNFTYLNERAARTLGRSREALIGKNLWAEFPQLAGRPFFGGFQKAMDNQRFMLVHDYEAEVDRWFENHVYPSPQGASVFVHDVTESKRAEAQVLALNAQLASHAAELEQRVAERTAALDVARHRAESADRLKSAFLASMSHELRTPLNSILGFTGVILQGLAGPVTAEQKKQLEMVRVSGRHLLALINDVLDLSKIEAGELVVSRLPLDPRVSIDKVAALVQPLAAKKGLTLSIRVAPEVGPIVGDARRIEQVLLNLLGNAIKFTQRGEVNLQVDVQAAPALAMLRFVVVDTGIGISAEDLDSLFQPFRQLDAGLARNHEGTGLGLAICRRLAGLMGGVIVAQSDQGHGSVFTFTLPLAGGATR